MITCGLILALLAAGTQRVLTAAEGQAETPLAAPIPEPISSVGPAVIIITHGFQGPLHNDVPWMHAMADAISARRGPGLPIYNVIITDEGLELETTAPAMTVSSKGAIVTVDWSDAACCTFDTTSVALEVANVIFANPDLMFLPIHLIGHSRGGSVMAETSRLLASRGILVDQLTTLDPQPVVFDAPVGSVWQNVIFSDNYVQHVGFPEGNAVTGAYAVDLNEAFAANDAPHRDVHTFYHGTIDGREPLNVDGRDIDPDWYTLTTGIRDKTGFFFSRSGGGELVRRTLAYRSGLHTDLGGAGLRFVQALAPIAATWPNIALKPLSRYDYQIGQPITVPFIYQDRQHEFDIIFRLDDDTDPTDTTQLPCGQFNAADTPQVSSHPGGLRPDNLHIGTSELVLNPAMPVTSCYLRAEIRNNFGRRFDYLPRKVTFSAGPVGPSLVYAVDDTGRLGTINLTAGTSSIIGNVNAGLTDVAATSSGALWGVDFDWAYSVNKATGNATALGFLFADGGMNALVGRGNELLGASFNGHSLYRVSTVNGAASALSGTLGYPSSGDLAFYRGALYASVVNNGFTDLVRVDLFGGSFSAVNLGHITRGATIFGLVEGTDGRLYGLEGTSVWWINPANPAASAMVVADYSMDGVGLGSANGAASGASVAPGDVSVPRAGVNGATLTVTAIPGCFWTAVSDVNWISLSSGASGTGNGTVVYSVAPNPGESRAGTITVGGHVITITQISGVANTAPIQILGATAAPYPSTIGISGLTGTVTSVSVTLHGLSHAFLSDLDMVLVGPGGQALAFMSDLPLNGPVSGLTLTFTDSAATTPSVPLGSGAYRPMNSGGFDNFPAPGPAAYSSPAPAGSATLASVFGGTNPNGTWQLFVVDDFSLADSGVIDGGWSLSILTNGGPGTNVVQNGSFSNGTTGWQLFATPNPTYLSAAVVGGVLQFYRNAPPPGTTNQATVFQNTGIGLAAHVPVVAQFDLGNSSNSRKRISVLVLEHDFSDLAVCTFWLLPNSPLRTYIMRTHTSQAWTNASIYFYAATVGADGGAYLLDSVSLAPDATGSAGETLCQDPTAPLPTGGSDGAELLVNGGFDTGTTSAWGLFGALVSRVAAGVFEFYRPVASPNPAGVILQSTGQSAGAGDIVTAHFSLGNSSGIRTRVTVLLHDLDFSDLSACTFWLAPGQALSPYVMRTFATEAWGNTTISVYAATVADALWTRLDNVSLRATPGQATAGTDCIEPTPGSNPPSTATTLQRPAVAHLPTQSPQPGRADVLDDGAVVFSLRTPTRLALSGLMPGVTAEIQVSLDGDRWQTLIVLVPEQDWSELEIDLSSFAGEVVYLRIVYRR